MDERNGLEARITELEAKNRRQREALEIVRDCEDCPDPDGKCEGDDPDVWYSGKCLYCICVDALAGEGGEDESGGSS